MRRTSSYRVVTRIAALTASALFVGLSNSSKAASSSWTATSAGNWSASANWNSGLPGSTTITSSTDLATFNVATGTAVTVDQTTQNIGSITFSGAGTSGYTIGSTAGNVLLLSAGSAITNSVTGSATETINAPLTLEGATTFNNSAGSSTLTFGGSINGTGSVAQTAGTVFLSGNNTYTGLTTLNLGVMNITGNNAAPAGGTLSVYNTAATGTAVLNFTGGANFNNAASILLNASASSVIAAEITVGGTATNTATVNNSGAVTVERLSEIYIQAGGLWNQTGSNLFQVGPSTQSTNYSTVMLVSGVFNDTQTVPFYLEPTTGATKVGLATLNISSGLFVTGQTFNFSTAAASTAPSVIILANGGTIGLSSNIASLTTGATGAIQVSGGVIDTYGYNTSINNPISNLSTAGSFAVTGGGTVTLGATNTYTGSTAVNQGATLVLGSGTSLINSSSTLSLGGGTLSLNGTGTQTFNGIVIAAGASTIADASSNPLALGAFNRSTGGTVDFGTLAGPITTTTANTNGILGGYATVGGGANWASVVSGSITAYSNTGASYNTSTNAGTTAANYSAMNIDVTSSPGTLSGPITPYTLRFNTATPFTLALNGTNTVTGGILVTPSVGANAQTISGGVLEGSAGGDLVVNQYNANASGGLMISSTIADNTTATGFTKSGPGTVTLTGANTYTGVTNVNAGTLIVGNYNSSSGVPNGSYTVASGATLELGVTNANIANEPGIAVNGSGLSSSAGLYFKGGVTWQIDGGLSILTQPTTVGTYGTGSAILIGYDITTGNYITTSAQASGSILTSGITLQTHTHGFALSSTAGANNATGDLVVSGPIGGNGNYSAGSFTSGLIKNGNGSLLLTAASNYTSGTDIGDGQIILSGGSNRLPVTTIVALGGGSVVSPVSSAAGQLLLSGISQQVAGIQTLGTANNNSVLGNSATFSTLIVSNGAPDSFTGYLGGSGPNNNNLALTEAGSSTLTLSSENTFSGGTTISSGTIIVAATNIGTISGALGPSAAAVTLGDVNTGAASPILQINSGMMLSNPISVSNQGSGTPTIAAAGSAGGAASVAQGTITLNQSVTINNANANVSPASFSGASLATAGLLIEGNITGTGGITFTGGEVTSVVSGTASYTGPTLVTGNSLVQYGTSASTDASSVLNISAGSTVVSAAIAAGHFGGLIGAAGSTFAATTPAASNISIGALNDPSDNFAGTISGALNLTKTGSGTQILSGSNNYSGSTAIAYNGGNLQITNAAALGTGTVTINRYATGSGTLQINIPGTNSITNTFGGFSSGGFTGSTTVPDIENISGNNTITSNLTVTSTGGTGIAVESDAGLLTLSGTIGTTVDAARGIELNGAGNGAISGAITNGNQSAFSVTMDGTGTWTLSGPNTYAGATTINAGTVTGTGSTPFGATNAMYVNNTNNTSAGTAVVLNLSTSAPTTIGTLSGTISTPTSGINTATINNGGQLLTIDATSAATYAGVIAGTGGLDLNVNVSGGRTLTLSGNETYTGLTTVTGGTLTLTGNDSAATGGFLVGNASTLVDYLYINSGAVVDVSSTNSIVLNNTNTSPGNAELIVGVTGTATLNNSGALDVYRGGYVVIGAGSTLNQSGSMAVTVNTSSGYTSVFTVNGILNYTGGTAINLSPSTGTGTAQANLTVFGAAAVFTTGQGFQNAVASSGGSSNFNLSGGGTLALSASIPALTSTSGSAFNFILGAGGGIINTNSFAATMGNIISGNGSLTVTGTTGSLTLSNANTYSGGTNVSGGTVILAAAGALPSGGNLTIGSGASVFANNLGNAVAISVGSLSVAGKLDLNNNALVVHNSSLGAITSLAQSSYNNGWNGSSGLASHAAANDSSHLTALGVIVNDAGGTGATGYPLYGANGSIGTTFSGASPVDGDILVKYTYYGDANLDGKVDGSDYARIDASYLAESTQSTPFSTGVSGWYNGDFNYDGVVNGSDYTLIDNAFNTQGSQIAAEIASPTAQIAGGVSGTSAVPEPTTLGLLGIGALGLLGRRSRRRN